MLAFAILNIAAIFCIFKYQLPRPFPWEFALVFVAELFVGGFSPVGTFAKFYIFLGVLSAVIVGAYCARPGKLAKAMAIGLAVFVVADALRLIPTPDVVMTPGELWFGGLVRRPYLLSHPNLVAGWSLLLPFGPWTVLTVFVTQSRGALAGIVAVLVARFVPRKYLVPAALVGAAVLIAATFIRPGPALARFDFWNEGIRLFLARPITGFGSGSYSNSLTSSNPLASEMAAVVQRTGMGHAHNALITVAAENGLGGLLPYLSFIVALAILVKNSNHPAKWGLLAFAVQQIFDDQLFDPVTAIILGVVLGICLFAPNSQRVAAQSRQEALQRTPVGAQVN